MTTSSFPGFYQHDHSVDSAEEAETCLFVLAVTGVSNCFFGAGVWRLQVGLDHLCLNCSILPGFPLLDS